MRFFCKTLLLLLLLISSNVFAFDTTQIIFHVHGDTATSRLGQNLTSLGDINNDGYDDIAISSVYPKGTYIYYGGFPIDTVADIFITGNLGAADPIDLDGDGINEIITTELVNQFPDKISILYFYKGFLDSIASVPYDSLNPPIDNYNLGGSGLEGVKTRYIDSDSLGDVLTFQLNKPGGPKLLFYKGLPTIDKEFDWSFQVLNYSHYFSGFGFIDFNGDNIQDIYLGLGPDTDSLGFVYIFLGPNFDTIPNIIIEHPKDLDSLNPDF
ncbi:MAG TPA: hypothetical protein ENH23_03885, partial [candidate division Zixibacteria bacterium]|nr:hypothetical protein [candidate division Zixibacteria bacterium]